MTIESTIADYYASETVDRNISQQLADEEWIYGDSYYHEMAQARGDDDQPSGVVVNGFELTNAQLREYSGYDDTESEDEYDDRLEAYLEELEEDFRVGELGVDPNDDENYGGFHRIVKSKREFS